MKYATTMRAASLLAPLLLVAVARADDDPIAGVDAAAKKKGTGVVVAVVFAKEDSDDWKAVKTAVADKRLAKAVKDGTVFTRLDLSDSDGAKKLGVSAENAFTVVVLDGYGIEAGKTDKVPSADSLGRLVKQAEDATTKKKATEKKLDAALKKGEAAQAKDDPKTACDEFLAIDAYAATIPCDAVTKAKKHLEELETKANGILEKVRQAIEQDQLAQARKLLAEVESGYPIPAVKAAAKTVREELAEAEAESK